jgi:hypothetical protein
MYTGHNMYSGRKASAMYTGWPAQLRRLATMMRGAITRSVAARASAKPRWASKQAQCPAPWNIFGWIFCSGLASRRLGSAKSLFFYWHITGGAKACIRPAKAACVIASHRDADTASCNLFPQNSLSKNLINHDPAANRRRA